MATVKALLTSNNTITITLASLATASARQSASVSNATNLYDDALVQVKVKTGASGTSVAGYCNVFVYASADGGTTFTDNATGLDAAITLTAPPNLRLLGIINTVANATTYVGGPFSVATCFGGVLPDTWGIVIDNESGSTLDATAGNHKALYEGVQYTVA